MTCLTFAFISSPHYNNIDKNDWNSDNVFPRSMPYCDVDLTPHWDYDLEKAILLSCNLETESAAAASVASAASSAADNNKALMIGLGVGIGCVALVAAIVAVYFMKKAKSLEVKFMSKSGVEA